MAIASSHSVPPENSPRMNPRRGARSDGAGHSRERRYRHGRASTAPSPSTRSGRRDRVRRSRPASASPSSRRRRERAWPPPRPAASRRRPPASCRGACRAVAIAARVERPPTAADRSRPPTPRTAVTPTPAASSRQLTCCAPVPDAATTPTGPGLQHVGEAETDPADRSRPAVGAHHKQPTPRRLLFQAHLLGDRDVVGEQHDRDAGVYRVHRLDECVLPRDRDERERAAPGAKRSAEGVRAHHLTGATSGRPGSVTRAARRGQ